MEKNGNQLTNRMTEAQIKELTDMLVALEQQLQNQNGPSVSASDSSSANPGQITVKVPRERKLGKFAGRRDDGILEEWIGDDTRAIAGQIDADGMDFLPYHLDSVAKEAVRLHPAEKKAIPAAVFKVPRDCFSEGLTNTQAPWKFFKKRQRDYESVCEFSYSFMLCLAWVEHLDAAVVKDKDKLLRDQFLENLADPQLRRDIKCCVDTTPPKPSKRSEMRFSAGLTRTEPPQESLLCVRPQQETPLTRLPVMRRRELLTCRK